MQKSSAQKAVPASAAGDVIPESIFSRHNTTNSLFVNTILVPGHVRQPHCRAVFPKNIAKNCLSLMNKVVTTGNNK